MDEREGEREECRGREVGEGGGRNISVGDGW